MSDFAFWPVRRLSLAASITSLGLLFPALPSPGQQTVASPVRPVLNFPLPKPMIFLPAGTQGDDPGSTAANSDATDSAPLLTAASLPDAPSATLFSTSSLVIDGQQSTEPQKPCSDCEVDAEGHPIPLNRRQPKRILGFMPNFRSVSGGAVAHPPGWKYNFTVATHQAFDYSSFIFLFLTSISAEGLNEHPVLGKGVGGFYAYGWRGFLDKTDGNYLGGWFLPSLLHEDTRYYAKGDGHSITYRALYVMSRQVVTRTYGGHDTPNISNLGGKVLAQLVSRQYYPTGATSFGVLAEKFGYSVMRDVGFTAIREFYPDIAAHYVQKHRAKAAAQAAADARSSTPPTLQTRP